MSKAQELADVQSEAQMIAGWLESGGGHGVPSMHALRAARELRRLDRVNAELREALNELYLACPTSLDCKDFHHSKAERHSFDQPCKPAADFLLSLSKARAALSSSGGNES